tara:strand:+ start:4209 stop:4622 length:414 start_codon:yes stop_codon:yes gene_type:complete
MNKRTLKLTIPQVNVFHHLPWVSVNIKKVSTLLSTNTYSFFASLVKTSKARISIEACVLNNLLDEGQSSKLSHDARVILTRLLYELVIAYMPKFTSAMYCLYKSYTIEHPFESLFFGYKPKIKQEYTDKRKSIIIII